MPASDAVRGGSTRRRAAHWAAALLLAAGCTHTYGLEHDDKSDGVLDSRSVVYVVQPEAGHYSTRAYTESGRQTRDAIAQALAPHVRKVVVGVEPEQREAALASARAKEATRAAVPTIRHWEDRATEWTGKPDRIEVEIQIFDVSSGSLLDAATVTGKSRWLTFGGDHPQELLPQALADYVAELVPETTAASGR